MEAVLIVVTIAQRYQLRLEPGQSIVPHAALTLRPHPKLRMRLEARPAGAAAARPVETLQAAIGQYSAWPKAAWV